MATTSMKEIQYLYDYYHLASISVWEKSYIDFISCEIIKLYYYLFCFTFY